jgi:chromosome segregation ATPase
VIPVFFFSQFLQDSSTFLLRCQRDDQSIQIICREMLQKEANQLGKDEKRLEKQLQKTLDKIDKLQKKNQKLEKEISNLELDPKVLEGRDHELRVQLDALESTNKSLRNVTNNQKSEFEAMRRAAQEFEDALKVYQVRELVFIHCAEEETVIFNFHFIIRRKN